MTIEKPIVNDHGRVTRVPEGYFWCPDCQALSPHEKNNCIVCGHWRSEYLHSCHVCGWEDKEDGPGELIETLHHEGCHCDSKGKFQSHAEKIAERFYDDWMRKYPNRTHYSIPKDNDWYYHHQKIRKQWQEAYNVKCGCPIVTLFRNLNFFEYQCGHRYTQDCSNAMWWSYNIRCPICGNVFNVSDSNC